MSACVGPPGHAATVCYLPDGSLIAAYQAEDIDGIYHAQIMTHNPSADGYGTLTDAEGNIVMYGYFEYFVEDGLHYAEIYLSADGETWESDGVYEIPAQTGTE